MKQKQELVRPIVKVGNSAGVLLPKEWLNGKASISLLEEPLKIEKDVFEIIGHYLKDVMGIYLVGSYARGEQTERSDVDILIITNETDKKIIHGKYNITLISMGNLESSLENNVMPIFPMLKEAKAILNSKLIKKYEKTELRKQNVEGILEITKSSLDVSKEFIKLSKETNEKLGDGISYSLVLNFRTIYLLNCLKNNKKWSSKELRNLIKKIGGGLEAYEGYVRSKNKEKDKNSLLIEEAERIYKYLIKELTKWEKWLKERRN